MEPIGTSDRRALLILGMHRSGTSAVTRVVNMLGADIGHDLIPAAHDNPTGFWEHAGVVRINEELLQDLGRTWYDMREMPTGWMESEAGLKALERADHLVRRDFANSRLCAVKDPRMCLTAGIWVKAFRDAGFEVHCLFVIRDPREVVDSLHQRNNWPRAPLYLMWVQYLLEAEAGTRDCRRAMVVYEQILTDWRERMERIGNALHLAWPAELDSVAGDVGQFLDPAMRHHKSMPPEEPVEHDEMVVPTLAEKLYNECMGLAHGKGKWRTLSEMHAEFRQAAELYGAHVDRLLTERWDAEARAQTAATLLDNEASVAATGQQDIVHSRELVGRLEKIETDVGSVQESLSQFREESLGRSDELHERLLQHQDALQKVEARLERLRPLLQTALLRLEQMRGDHALLNANGNKLSEHGKALHAIDTMLRIEVQELRQAQARSDTRLAGVLASTSWKLTKPLRWFSVHVLRRPPSDT